MLWYAIISLSKQSALVLIDINRELYCTMGKNYSHQQQVGPLVGPGQVPSLPIDKDGTATSYSATSIS